ncbi:MAG: Ig-like domain-containing protein, partial [Bacteroidales bacterium]|nr:Ig-like domain-containing protein [Bacteroidales bacterium]
DGGKTATCQVTVNARIYNVESVSLDKTSITLTEGDSQTLTATVYPANATNKKVSWKSSDESVATVSNGQVTALKAGTATITVTTEDGGKTATCQVTVNAKVYNVESVSLDKTSITLTEGDSETLTATVSPSNATNKNVSWKSSNTSVATVSNGKVTALKAGTATITVTTEDGGKTATCQVTVYANHTSTGGSNEQYNEEEIKW